MKRLLVIINASAGTTEHTALDDAVAVLRTGADVHVTETSDADDLDRAVDGRDGRDLVMVGGDGSMHAVMQTLDRLELLGTDDCPSVALIPAGTGNDLARGIRLSLEATESAGVALTGRTVPMDLIADDSGELVVNALHCGVGAEAGLEAKPWKRAFGAFGLGRIGYAVGGVVAAVRTRGCRLRVEVDGRELVDGSRHLYQVGIANGAFVGGGMKLVPGSEPTDATMDVLVSYAVPLTRRVGYGLSLLRGRHVERDDVVKARGAEVTVSAMADGDTFTVNADGELTTGLTTRRWNLRPRAVPMVLPREDQRSGHPSTRERADPDRTGETRSTDARMSDDGQNGVQD